MSDIATGLDPDLVGERIALDAVPIVDFGPFLLGGADERHEVANQIGRACRDIGFFYLTGHGIPARLVTHTFDVCRRFFDLPAEDKAEIAIAKSTCHRGWFAVGFENLDPAKQQTVGDLKEGIKIGHDLPLNHVKVQAGIALHGPNQWPAEPEDFVPTARELYFLLSNLARELMAAFALAVGLAEDHFERWLTVPMATLGPLHYPPQTGPISEAQLGAGAHTDFGCLTILAQDDVGGLQVRNVAGQWIAAPPLENTFVVNIGDMMARWTNDLFASTYHRVINTSGQHRYSIPFFFDPSHDAPIECLPTCSGPDSPPRYAPTTGLAHLQEMIDASFNYRTVNEDPT